MKKLSIGSWAFLFNQEQPTNDFHSLVHKLGHLGYPGIELGAFAPHPNPDSHDTKEKRQKLRKMVIDHRQEFSALAPDLRTQKLWSVEDQAPYLAALESNLIFAEDLGVTTVRVDTVEPITLANEVGIEPKLLFDRCVSAFDRAAKQAAPHGVTLAWEFEPGFPINTPSEIVALVDVVRGLGNPNFGALYNTGYAQMCGGALELLQQLKGKISHLHFADSDGSTLVPLGQGVLNFDQLMPELMACGVPNDWWCVDLGSWPDTWSVTADCKRFLDKLRHKYAA